MNNYCLYHRSCADGFGSALAVWQKYRDSFQYIAVQYGESLPEMTDIYNLYIVDFSYDLEIIKSLSERCKELVIIDHHEKASFLKTSTLPSNVQVFFNENYSGATLTYMHINNCYYTHVPLFFQYLEDRDLWRWKLPNSRAFSAGLDLIEMNFVEWDRLARIESLASTINRGTVILSYINKKVKELASRAVVTINEDGQKVAMLNSSLFQSELGEYLNDNLDVDYADIHFIKYKQLENNEAKAKMIHSLRSNGKVNVTDIAITHGGGGHPSGKTAGYWEGL